MGQSNFPTLIRSCSTGPGASLIEAFHPGDDDYFVLKPQRSGFYLTPLGLLLQDLRVQHLILCGIATDMCVLATANDACMRNFSTSVVSDGTASFDEGRHRRALEVITVSLQATARTADDIST